METEKSRKPGLLFTRPDAFELCDFGNVVEQDLGDKLRAVMTTAIYETEFIEELTLAKYFARNNPNEMVFVKLTMVPRKGACAEVKSHLECVE